MSATVPRRAVFDDLRVGQWVAWCDDHGWATGTIGGKSSVRVKVDPTDAPSWLCSAAELDLYQMVVLEDAPAPPVKVRREDYDQLAELVERFRQIIERDALITHEPSNVARLGLAARALVDNTDTGDTP